MSDIREEVARAIAVEQHGSDIWEDLSAAWKEEAADYADAALSVVAPVLEGLRTELETTRRMWEASARDNDRMAEELDR